MSLKRGIFGRRDNMLEGRPCQNTGEYRVKMEAETGIMLSQTTGHLGLPGDAKGKEGSFFPRFQREHGPMDTLILDS